MIDSERAHVRGVIAERARVLAYTVWKNLLDCLRAIERFVTEQVNLAVDRDAAELNDLKGDDALAAQRTIYSNKL